MRKREEERETERGEKENMHCEFQIFGKEE